MVEAWRVAKNSVTRSVSSTGSANLDVVASAGLSVLRVCACSVKLIASAVGTARIAPHIHLHIVRHWFGTVQNFLRVDQLLRFLAPGSPVCVARRGYLTAQRAYGNYPSVAPHAVAVHRNLCSDVCTVGLWCLNYVRRLIFGVQVFRRWPSCLIKPKFRIIHDLTFACAGGHSSVEEDADFSFAPSFELRHVLWDVLLRVLVLRQMHGSTDRIVSCRVDVLDAFRQGLVDPLQAPVFGYAMGKYVVVDLRLQFGTRNSTGF